MELSSILRDLAAKNRALGVWAACAVVREGLRAVPAHEKRPLKLLQAAEAWAQSPDKRKSILVLSRMYECEELLKELDRVGQAVHPKFIEWVRVVTKAAMAAASPIISRGNHGLDGVARNIVNVLVEAQEPITQREANRMEAYAEEHLEKIAHNAADHFPRSGSRANPRRKKRW